MVIESGTGQSIRKEYRKSTIVSPCRLLPDDLVKLSLTMRESPSVPKPHEAFEVSTQSGHVEITASSIEDFLAQQEDFPDKITNLHMYLQQRPNERTFHTAGHIQFDSHGNSFVMSVSGTDETWVMGKYAQLLNFFAAKRPNKPWYSSLLSLFLSLPFGLVLALVSGIVLGYSLAVLHNVPLALSAGLAWVLWLYPSFPSKKGTILPPIEIAIRAKPSSLTKENITLILSVASVIVSVIALVVTVILGVTSYRPQP